MPFIPVSYAGILHHVSPRLIAFEHTSRTTRGILNTILFIGGLGDHLLNVPYPTAIAQSLPPNWTLARVLLTSAHSGWGTSSLQQDAKELGQIVEYFKRQGTRGKIVLMGHSTGCQDAMEYCVGKGSEQRPAVQGVILQAGVSDREGMVESIPDDSYNASVKVAEQYVSEGKGEHILPSEVTKNFFGPAPVTARRWLSLASPRKDGDDDYFSTDLEDERLRKTFGAMKRETPVLILFSGKDQHVPGWVDKKALVEKWTRIVKEGGGAVDEEDGGLVEGASHSLLGDPEEVVKNVVDRVNGFLRRLDEDDFKIGSNL